MALLLYKKGFKIKKVFHLSHTDLDGYSCQLVMSYTDFEMVSFNANYGAEVPTRIEEILDIIKKQKCESTILISDLNLNTDESRNINKEVERLNENGIKTELLLLDHHGSGEDSAKKYDWYNLDVTRCATKIVYDYAKEHFNLDEPLWLEKFVDVVNAVDLWKKEEEFNFEFGKVCMRAITDTRELSRNIFPKEDRAYKLQMLKSTARFLDKADANILLDENIHLLKKEFFKKDKNDTLDNLITARIVELFEDKKPEMTIYYKGYKGFLSYSVGNTSIIGNGFLVANEDYDFIVDISPRGTLSFRANNGVNVAKMSKELVNGGGHPNAAGGRIQGFREQYVYSKVKMVFTDLLEKKESTQRDLEFKKS